MKKYVLMLLALALLPLAVQAEENYEAVNIPDLAAALETQDQEGFIAKRIDEIKNTQAPSVAFSRADALFKDLIQQVMYNQIDAADPQETIDLEILAEALKDAKESHKDFTHFLKNNTQPMNAFYSLEDFASNHGSKINRVASSAKQAGIHFDFAQLMRDILDHKYKWGPSANAYSLSSIAGTLQRLFEQSDISSTTPTWIVNGKNFYAGMTAGN